MKHFFSYFSRGTRQLAGKIAFALILAITAQTILHTQCFSQGDASQAISALHNNAKINAPDAILKNFEEGKSVTRVIVNIIDPAGDLQTQNGAGHAGTRNNFNDMNVRAQLQNGVANAQDIVINSLPLANGNVKITNKFIYIFGFSAEVTLQGLEALVNNPNVLSIDDDMILEPHLNQGIPLMNASTVRNTYNGSGLAIAICDTGIDYTHVMLGNAAFPNDKVIGGRDTGEDDDDPMDGNGHGTSVAGIAAGTLGAVGDYIGGVAYNAKLYALKISSTPTGGSAFTSDMVEAWEWCVTHQNDDVNNPIMIINTSFGGGRHFNQTTCDASSAAMFTAASNANAVGMTHFVSSGNDGFCDSMGWPGCLSNVIGVGAVYDASLGTKGWCVDAGSCIASPNDDCTTEFAAFDNTTAADMVTAYSNSASFLTLFAPSNDAHTPTTGGGYTTTFGGTSAASPYAAGAGAALQSAAIAMLGRFLTNAELKSSLVDNGDPTTDSKVAITKPRVDLGASVNVIGVFRVNVGQTVKIDEHGICSDVTNNGTDDIFVPARTAAEWTAFRNNLPTGVTAPACL